MMKFLAVHLHLYYESQLRPLARALGRLDISGKADIFVTYPEDRRDLALAASTLSGRFASVFCHPVPNAGYDIGPFLKVVSKIDLASYRYVLKIHTKGRGRSWNYTRLGEKLFSDALWTDTLTGALIGSKEAFQRAVRAFDDPGVGMVSASQCIVQDNPIRRNLILQGVNHELKTRFALKPVSELRFVAGTMFMVRAETLSPLRAASDVVFEASSADVKDYTSAHIYERLFSAIVTAQGFRLAGLPAPRRPIEEALVLSGSFLRALVTRGMRFLLRLRAWKTVLLCREIRRSSSPLNAALIHNSKFFDAGWYGRNCMKEEGEKGSPAVHYLTIGWREGRNPSEIFNADDYCRANPDAAGECPLLFYERIGRFENRPLGTGRPAGDTISI